MIKKQVLNALQIKIIIALLMLLNHLDFVYGFYSENLRTITIFLSRGVAPMFAYLTIEGIIHTRSLKKYCIRLWLWAVIIYLGNSIVNYSLQRLASIPAEQHIYLTIRTNISITLATGVSCIALIIFTKKNKKYESLTYGLSTICFVLGFLSEWGIVLLPFMLVTYFFREKYRKKYVGYLLIEAIAILVKSEIYYFLVFPLISLYNGKRGSYNRFSKYFFYVFYPFHLWIIAIVNFIILN